jgi:hypothetical protein
MKYAKSVSIPNPLWEELNRISKDIGLEGKGSIPKLLRRFVWAYKSGRIKKEDL